MRADAPAPELMTVKELAAEWRQHPASIYRKIQEGTIPAFRTGGGTSALRISRSDLERIYEQSTVGGDSSVRLATVGRSSSVDAPAERDGTFARRKAVEPARLVRDETEGRTT